MVLRSSRGKLPLSFIRASQSSPSNRPPGLGAPLKDDDGYRKNIHPRGFVAQAFKQMSRSNSQFGPITSGIVGGATCWVPTVGGGVPVPRSLTHTSNADRQLVEHTFWTILFFEMGAKLPAKLVAIEQKRIIAAALSFICATPKSKKVCASIK